MATRQDFAKTARIIKLAREVIAEQDWTSEQVVDFICSQFASQYANDNPRFDQSKFFKACQ